MAIFQVNLGLPDPSGFSLSTCCAREPLSLTGTVYKRPVQDDHFPDHIKFPNFSSGDSNTARYPGTHSGH